MKYTFKIGMFFALFFLLGMTVVGQTEEIKKTKDVISDDMWSPSVVRVNAQETPVILGNIENFGYQKALIQAMSLHNYANSLQNQILQADDYKYAVVNVALAERRLTDLTTCNIKLLQDHFIDAKSVWDKMKSEADRMYQEVSISETIELNEMSEKDLEILAGITNDGGSSSALLNEIKINLCEEAIEWTIGHSILTDLYYDQDAQLNDGSFKWGERKTPTTPSFSLWQDQKFLYDKQIWDPKYIAINTFFKEPLERRPKILGDNQNQKRFDYYFYNDVVKAHEAYLKQLKIENFQKPARVVWEALPAELKEPPKVAPRPLPPRSEIVLFDMDDEDANGNLIQSFNGVCLGYPQPWQTFIDNQFRIYNARGEMAFLFDVNRGAKTITPRWNEREVIDSMLPKPNRISRYLTTQYELKKRTAALEEQRVRVAELKLRYEDIASKNGVKLPDNLHYGKKEDLQKVKDAFLKERDELLALIKKEYPSFASKLDSSDMPLPSEEEQKRLDSLAQPQVKGTDETNTSWEEGLLPNYVALAKAMNYDSRAEVTLYFSNVENIAEEMATERANTALAVLSREQLAEARNEQIKNETRDIYEVPYCVNGGIIGEFVFDESQI